MENCRRDCWRGSSRHPNLQISLDMHAPEAIELLRIGKIDVAIIFRYDETEPEPAAIRPIPCSTTPCTSCHRARNGPWPTCATRRGSPAAIASPRSTSARVKSKKRRASPARERRALAKPGCARRPLARMRPRSCRPSGGHSRRSRGRSGPRLMSWRRADAGERARGRSPQAMRDSCHQCCRRS